MLTIDSFDHFSFKMVSQKYNNLTQQLRRHAYACYAWLENIVMKYKKAIEIGCTKMKTDDKRTEK